MDRSPGVGSCHSCVFDKHSYTCHLPSRGRRSDSGTTRVISVDCGLVCQAEDGIRCLTVTGVQTCALPITRVLSLGQRRDGTWDVVTDKGTVHAEHVVNCAGLWAREVGHMVGIELPVLAMEHHYLLTEDIPELAGRDREIVNTTDYAGEIYLRQERAGVLIGTYEPHGIVWSPVRTPDEFSMQLLPEDFERLAPYFEVGFRHFPALARVGIRKAVNGPFTFAPDGNPLVGPVRGVRNFWVACAVMAGFSQGGGIGLVLSRWMAENDPGQDIISMDVARFGAFPAR